MNDAYDARIGIDLGGTKTEIVVLDNRGMELRRRRVPTPAHDYDSIIETITKLVDDSERELGVNASVGVATPGAISATSGLIKNANTTALIGRPLDRDLSSAMGRPVRVDNDANCFALSEAIDGSASDLAVVFGVIIGTGTGGSIVANKRLLVGRNRIAGEWGHNPMPWPRSDELPGPACYCGKRGCIETFLSGPGMMRDHAHRTGREAEPSRIAQQAQSGDTDAIETLSRYYDRIARCLTTVVNLLDPDGIVLGGGMSHLPGLGAQIEKRLDSLVFSDTCNTPIRLAAHGDASGVRGAAWLWPAPSSGS